MYNYKFLILSSTFVSFFPPFFSSTRIVLIKVVVVAVDAYFHTWHLPLVTCFVILICGLFSKLISNEPESDMKNSADQRRKHSPIIQ